MTTMTHIYTYFLPPPSHPQVIDMISLLGEPKAFECMVKFINRNERFEDFLVYIKTWEELKHFKVDFDKMSTSDQKKKATEIFKKTIAAIKMPSHLKALTKENVNGGTAASGPGKDCFDDLSNFLCDMLQTKIQIPFLFSELYTEFLAKVSKRSE